LAHFPPKPILSLTVGVIGHRLYRGPGEPPAFDAAAVSDRIEKALVLIRSALQENHERHGRWFDPRPPLLSCVCSLAEGADRIGAAAARRLDIPFDVILPSDGAAFEATFVDDSSRAEFAHLLAGARAVMALPPIGDMMSEDSRALSYEQAATTLLGQSDLLLAVWDGQPARGAGGSGQTMDEAAQRGAPMIVVASDGALSLLGYDDPEFPLNARHAQELAPRPDFRDGLEKIIEDLIAPPGPHPEKGAPLRRVRARLRRAGLGAVANLIERRPVGDEESEGLRVYLASPVERRIPHLPWRILRFALLGFRRDAAKAEVQASTPFEATRNEQPFARLDRAMRAADKIGVHYSNGFRSAFALNFILGALAVFFVALPIMFPAIEQYLWPFTEYVCVALVVLITYVARRRHWRRRWFEAREVSERLRAALPFWSLGAWPLTMHARQPGWPGWYVRALLREMPVFDGDLARTNGASTERLRELAHSQIRYHEKTASDAKIMDRWLEFIGEGVLGFTAIIFVVEFAARSGHALFAHPENWTRALSIFLPALATACYGIRLLADFEDTALRSERALDKLQKLLKKLEGRDPGLSELRIRARQTARIMLADLESWRVAVESRNISA
jgi:hypothetical protein